MRAVLVANGLPCLSGTFKQIAPTTTRISNDHWEQHSSISVSSTLRYKEYWIDKSRCLGTRSEHSTGRWRENTFNNLILFNGVWKNLCWPDRCTSNCFFRWLFLSWSWDWLHTHPSYLAFENPSWIQEHETHRLIQLDSVVYTKKWAWFTFLSQQKTVGRRLFPNVEDLCPTGDWNGTTKATFLQDGDILTQKVNFSSFCYDYSYISALGNIIENYGPLHLPTEVRQTFSFVRNSKI